MPEELVAELEAIDKEDIEEISDVLWTPNSLCFRYYNNYTQFLFDNKLAIAWINKFRENSLPIDDQFLVSLETKMKKNADS